MNLWAENNIIVEYVGKTDAFCWQAFYVVIREFFLRPNLFYHWLLLRNGQRFSFLRCTGGWYQNWISRLCWEDGYVLDVVLCFVSVDCETLDLWHVRPWNSRWNMLAKLWGIFRCCKIGKMLKGHFVELANHFVVFFPGDSIELLDVTCFFLLSPN